MAYGSYRGMRSYVNKVFGIEEKLGDLQDGRRGPKIPLGAILTTWFWAFARGLTSTEQAGEMLADPRWRRRITMPDQVVGSPDTMARAPEQMDLEEVNELALSLFFEARRAGVLRKAGPYGQRCLLIDLNELFCSERVHCKNCQERTKTVGEGANKRQVTEYYHQAVAAVWSDGKDAWAVGWELVKPGEGELTTALRLLERLLPPLRKSIDLVMGDALYSCRPFFKLVRQHGLNGLAISSRLTEMDSEIDLLMKTEKPTRRANDVDCWAMDSTAWQKDVDGPLRILHYVNNAVSKPYRKERRTLRIITTAAIDVLPNGQGWQVGRARWVIENGAFNRLTRDYSLEHNYHHDTTVIAVLLFLRSLAMALTLAYFAYATARSKDKPVTQRAFRYAILVEDFVRYLDLAFAEVLPAPSG